MTTREAGPTGEPRGGASSSSPASASAAPSAAQREDAAPSDVLRAEDLTFSYQDRDVLGGVSLRVTRGELLGVLGPNGSGKTTLVRCLMGFLPPKGGRVTLGGRELASWPRRALARQIAVVPQAMPTDFPLRVRELVMLGRVPHLPARGLGFESAPDLEATEAALAAASISELADRPLHELSGGELRRAFVARALAQDTPFLLLDEPTSGLDLRHQLGILELLRRRAREGRAILAVMHDLNLAAAHCDRVVVMQDGLIAADGAPDTALEPRILSDVYGVDLRAVNVGSGSDGAARQILLPALRQASPAVSMRANPAKTRR
jgi:ABC-type cobalamin/Fe3+-siderophores transport system ATPase subunit